MSDPRVVIDQATTAATASGDASVDADVDMDATQATEDVQEFEEPTGEAQAEADEVIEEATAMESNTSFAEFLQSPIVEIIIGSEGEAVTLTAHHALLNKSPYLARTLAEPSSDSDSAVAAAPRPRNRLEMHDKSLDAVACFLQYLYTGEYYPKKTGGNRLELSAGDDDGVQLLRHARVYTLAEELEVKELAELALSKVHLVSATAQAEIQYARYVYGNTQKSDERIRRPIAAFWGQRSHVLRHEAEDEFKGLCIEYPEFAFDVLTYVLDSKERKAERDKESEVKQSSRKRTRQI